jgi:hypothetical protein
MRLQVGNGVHCFGEPPAFVVDCTYNNKVMGNGKALRLRLVVAISVKESRKKYFSFLGNMEQLFMPKNVPVIHSLEKFI